MLQVFYKTLEGIYLDYLPTEDLMLVKTHTYTNYIKEIYLITDRALGQYNIDCVEPYFIATTKTHNYLGTETKLDKKLSDSIYQIMKEINVQVSCISSISCFDCIYSTNIHWSNIYFKPGYTRKERQELLNYLIARLT
jgi:hypothetical protein